MRILYSALITATLIGSTFALGGCAAYDDDGYSSVSVGVSSYGDGYYRSYGNGYYPRHYWRHRGYYY
jgi:hypothetical protein